MTLNKIIKLCNENKQIALSMGIVTFFITSYDRYNQGAKVAEISILKPEQDVQNTKDKDAKNDTK